MGMGYFYGIDMTYIVFVLPALLFAMYAQFRVNNTFSRYSTLSCRRGYTGAEAARKILDMNGLYDVPVEHIGRNLTDHFDPKANVVRLSDATFQSRSVAALGVAAHEVGHAIQYATGYAPIRVRNSIVPAVQLASYAAWPIAIFGILFSFSHLATFGVLLFLLVVLFQLVTLPVEFNASSRALKTLESAAMLDDDELSAARKVLSAAAMTYVAATVTAIANLLRLLAITGVGKRRD